MPSFNNSVPWCNPPRTFSDIFHDSFTWQKIFKMFLKNASDYGDVVKVFFWVSFYYIFKKSKSFHFKSKAFLFSSDKFLTNQKLFVLSQKLFFFLMTTFLQIKSFSFLIKSFSFSYNKIFRNQKLFFFNQISFFWWFLHHSHTFLTPWHISSPYCAQINYCMRAIITCSWILTIHSGPSWI